MTNDSGMEFFDFCYYPGYAGDFAPIVGLVSLVVIFGILVAGLRRKATQRPFHNLCWWSERIGLCGSLASIVLLTKSFTYMLSALSCCRAGHFKDDTFFTGVLQFVARAAFACCVALAGVTVSIVLHALREKKGTSQQRDGNDG